MRKVLLLLLAGCFVASFAVGQGYPSRPVTFVVGFGAGGGTDLTGRGLAQAMGEYWGVTTTVINVTGGSGSIAAEQVLNAARDGYTILVYPEIIAAQAVMDFHPTTAFTDWQHFTAAGFNGVISVRPESPYQSIEELFDHVRNNPNTVTLGASSAGTIWHIQSELTRDVAGINFRFVPYQGSAPAQVAAVSGEIDVVWTSIGEQRDLLRSGQLRPLAVFTKEAINITDVGTVPPVTTAVPELEAYLPFSSFIGLAVPRDMPEEIQAAIEEAYLVAVASESFKTLIEGQLNGAALGYDRARSDEFVQRNTSVIAWLLFDLDLATKSPELFGIPRP
jgi:tripartite-type tricarboxylate transporter receptor subunit TctC